MIPNEYTERFIRLAKEFTKELGNNLEIDETAHGPGMGAGGVKQFVDGSECLDYSLWLLKNEEDRQVELRKLFSQLQESAFKAKTQILSLHSDAKIFGLEVYWMNIPSAVDNPLGHNGYFRLHIQAIVPSLKDEPVSNVFKCLPQGEFQ
jgi:hypothetical protein